MLRKKKSKKHNNVECPKPVEHKCAKSSGESPAQPARPSSGRRGRRYMSIAKLNEMIAELIETDNKEHIFRK